MIVARITASKVGGVIVGMSLMIILGCGDDTGLSSRYPVSGTVKYNGQPVPKGRIDFLPTDNKVGRSASGDIVDGYYSLTTATPKDGALPGSYKVTVTAMEVDTTELKAIAKGGQFHHDEAFAKANREAKKLVPSKYQLADTSGLTATVKAESNTNVNFDLKD
jgi:hypothetical protein